jgi:hypothetical protein
LFFPAGLLQLAAAALGDQAARGEAFRFVLAGPGA